MLTKTDEHYEPISGRCQCQRCGHKWQKALTGRESRRCPFCRSTFWKYIYTIDPAVLDEFRCESCKGYFYSPKSPQACPYCKHKIVQYTERSVKILRRSDRAKFRELCEQDILLPALERQYI